MQEKRGRKAEGTGTEEEGRQERKGRGQGSEEEGGSKLGLGMRGEEVRSGKGGMQGDMNW